MPVERTSGWGRFPVVDAQVLRPADAAAVERLSADATTKLPQGNLRSYGDAALFERVVSLCALRRVLDLDADRGRVRVEPGVTIGELADHVLPHGWLPGVLPGTAHSTVGGCVAADVHGKNHHGDGSFARWVDSLDVVVASGRRIRCSRAREPELFHATLGGMGLTGCVVEAELRLRRVPSAYARQSAVRAGSVAECCDLLSDARDRFPYAVAWIDALGGGRAGAHGLVYLADHASAAEAPRREGARAGSRGRRLPLDLLRWLFGRGSVRLLNSLRFHGTRRSAILPLRTFFHPLDAVRGWNRIYGPTGFLQLQFVVPPDAREVLDHALERVSRETPGAFLAVLKNLGDEAGPLSFPMRGFTLALDIPRRGRAVEVVRDLHRLIRDAGGRVYLAKDAVLEPDDFHAMVPRLGEFLAVKKRHDPEARFRSALSDRLGIT